MQRVAIARALVNNPDILLADEPTGALDTETSVQVMELLKEVAKDRLVVMVTHNPELAEEYATRIVKLRDGKITDDSDPYTVDESKLKAPEHKNMGKASMSFLTAMSLSFNNLRTKKGRTFLTSFAGSIGIIGIALILSLSNGVNTYISDLQKSTMTSYPITIEAKSMDLSSMMAAGKENTDSANDDPTHELDGVYSDGSSIEMASAMTTSITENNLTEFKKYLDNSASAIHEYIGENGIVYSYDTQFGVYTHDPDGTFVNTDGSTLEDNKENSGMSGDMGGMNMMGTGSSNSNFEEMLPGQNGTLISSAVTDSYDVLYGAWPSAYNEVVLVLDKNNEITASTLYELGVLPTSEYKELMEKINAGEEVTLETQNWSYEDICKQELYMIPACDTYVDNGNGTFTDISEDHAELEKRMNNAVQLKIVGVIRPSEDADYANISSAVGYTKALTDYIIEYTNDSAVVKAQKASPEINVLNGVSFSPSDDAAKVEDAKAYLSNLSTEEKANMCREILGQVYSDDPAYAQMMLDMSDKELAAMLDEYVLSSEDGEDKRLLMIYDSYISSGTYDDNMEAFGVVSLDAPSSISIYADSFENKDAISTCIDDYNKTVSEENQISYTDYVGLLMFFCHNDCQCDFLCVDCFRCRFPDCIFYYDWHYHLYLRSGAYQRNRYPSCYRCIQAQYFAGVQCGNLYYRTLFGTYRCVYYFADTDSCKCNYSRSNRLYKRECCIACNKRSSFDRTQRNTHSYWRTSPFKESCQERPRNCSAYRIINKKVILNQQGRKYFYLWRDYVKVIKTND